MIGIANVMDGIPASLLIKKPETTKRFSASAVRK
jgi:hypothetical protein